VNQYDVLFGEGKYRIVYDEKMHATVYRNGEPWLRKDIAGDNMVLALVQEIANLNETIAKKFRVPSEKLGRDLEL
jgi:hypothetical protein